MSAIVFFVRKGETRPWLCRCVIISSLHEDFSKGPFLLLTSSLTSCFSSEPCCNRALHPQTHTDDFNQKTGQIQQPIDFKTISYNYTYTVFSSCRLFFFNKLQLKQGGTTGYFVWRFKDTFASHNFNWFFHLCVTLHRMYNIIKLVKFWLNIAHDFTS